MGAWGAQPGGLGIVDGGEIPYRPEARAKKQENLENRMVVKVSADPRRFDTGETELQCYRPGVPRANYMPFPFQISRLLPWSAAGFVVMVVTGSLLFYAEPVQRYENLFFRMKMAALVLAVGNAWVFHRTIYRSAPEWDVDPVPPRRARVAGGVSLALWGSIIIAGRMIPYQQYWF